MAMAYTKSVPSTRPLKIFEGTLDLAEVAATTEAMAEVDLTVSGVAADDMAVSFFCTDTGFSLGIGNVRVKAADTISVVFANTDNAAVDEAGTLNYRLIVIPAI
jgi:hypothetical protein